jgi:hypothetical protein
MICPRCQSRLEARRLSSRWGTWWECAECWAAFTQQAGRLVQGRTPRGAAAGQAIVWARAGLAWLNSPLRRAA